MRNFCVKIFSSSRKHPVVLTGEEIEVEIFMKIDGKSTLVQEISGYKGFNELKFRASAIHKSNLKQKT